MYIYIFIHLFIYYLSHTQSPRIDVIIHHCQLKNVSRLPSLAHPMGNELHSREIHKIVAPVYT